LSKRARTLSAAKYIRFLEVVGLRPADNGGDIFRFPFILGKHKVEGFTQVVRMFSFKRALGLLVRISSFNKEASSAVSLLSFVNFFLSFVSLCGAVVYCLRGQ